MEKTPPLPTPTVFVPLVFLRAAFSRMQGNHGHCALRNCGVPLGRPVAAFFVQSLLVLGVLSAWEKQKRQLHWIARFRFGVLKSRDPSSGRIDVTIPDRIGKPEKRKMAMAQKAKSRADVVCPFGVRSAWSMSPYHTFFYQILSPPWKLYGQARRHGRGAAGFSGLTCFQWRDLPLPFG